MEPSKRPKVTITLNQDILTQIDILRGEDIPRSRAINRLLSERLEEINAC